MIAAVPLAVFQNPIALIASLGAAWIVYMVLIRRGVK